MESARRNTNSWDKIPNSNTRLVYDSEKYFRAWFKASHIKTCTQYKSVGQNAINALHYLYRDHIFQMPIGFRVGRKMTRARMNGKVAQYSVAWDGKGKPTRHNIHCHMPIGFLSVYHEIAHAVHIKLLYDMYGSFHHPMCTLSHDALFAAILMDVLKITEPMLRTGMIETVFQKVGIVPAPVRILYNDDMGKVTTGSFANNYCEMVG